MNKINKAQRDQMIAILMATVILIAGIYYGVVSGQQEKIVLIKSQTEKMRQKVFKANQLVNKKAEIKSKLELMTQNLADKESTMAPERDTYAWMLGVIKPMCLSHKGISLLVSQPDAVTETTILPHFHYKQVVFHIKGTALFHDLGMFIADFENSFPYFRIQGMEIGPSSISSQPAEDASGAAAHSTEAETLDFHFDIVIPVKPADSAPATK